MLETFFCLTALICALMIVVACIFSGNAGLVVLLLALLVPVALAFGLAVVARRYAIKRAVKWKRRQ